MEICCRPKDWRSKGNSGRVYLLWLNDSGPIRQPDGDLPKPVYTFNAKGLGFRFHLFLAITDQQLLITEWWKEVSRPILYNQNGVRKTTTVAFSKCRPSSFYPISNLYCQKYN